jgi:hypothetical protein
MLNIVFKAVEAYQVLSINNCFYLGNKWAIYPYNCVSRSGKARDQPLAKNVKELYKSQKKEYFP